ncbi:MAG: hypothetical protein N2317_01785 [Syntrophales bacterium]|nr:hypothetical protein [Syntrophales bacterium]
MAAKIVEVGVKRGGLFSRGSIDLEAKAARMCLKRANVDPERIGLLINAGLYRDEHIGEPAIAAFIQRSIKANIELGDKKGTFSFDLSNGGSGVLNAIMVVDGFLESGEIDYGLVVAGDAEPIPGRSVGYNGVPSAGAVLLGRGRENEGFLSFRAFTYPDFLDVRYGRMEWQEQRKENWLMVKEDNKFIDACVDCAVCSLEIFLSEIFLELDDIHLIVPSQMPLGFLSSFAKRTGTENRVVDVTTQYGYIHTAGILFALDTARKDGRFKAAVNVIFVSVGAGITVFLAFYRNTSAR